jgi:hypothetical protein
LTSYLAAYGFLVNLALFLYFIDSIIKLLDQALLQVVAFAGRELFECLPVETRRQNSNTLEPAEDFKDEHGRVVSIK